MFTARIKESTEWSSLIENTGNDPREENLAGRSTLNETVGLIGRAEGSAPVLDYLESLRLNAPNVALAWVSLRIADESLSARPGR